MEAEGKDIERLDGTYHLSVVARKNLRTERELGGGIRKECRRGRSQCLPLYPGR